MRDPRSFWQELKRRRVWRTVAVYAAVSWGVLQLADVVWEPLGLPSWTMTLVIVLVALGFPLVLTLEWAFEATGEGVRRTPESDEPVPGRSVLLGPIVLGGAVVLLVLIGAWRLTIGGPDAGAELRAPASGAEDPSAAAGAADPALKRLAVLPFTNIRGDPDLDYLGFALADEIIGAIAYVQNVLVRPSSAIRRYRDRTVDAETAGRELRVDYVLTGNFLEEHGNVRLNVELVEAPTNELLWREDVEVEWEDAFHLQDLVAGKVIDRLDVAFSPEERARARAPTPGDPLAYEYYLRGLSYPLTVDGSALAVAMLERSVAMDSSYAPAFTELGYRLHQVASYDVTERERTVRAERALRSALSLNAESLAALSNLAALYTETGRTGEAVQLLQRALRINPNSASARFYLGYVYRFGGCLDRAVAEQERALALDPGNPRFRSLGTTYVYQGELEEALAAFDLDPNSAFGYSWKGDVYFRMNRMDLALEHLQRAIDLEPEGIIGLWAAAHAAHITGDRAEGLRAVRALDGSGIFDSEQRYHAANLYGLFAAAADAARALGRAVEGGFYAYGFMRRDAFLDPVRSDPAVQRVLSRAESRHQAFARQHCSS